MENKAEVFQLSEDFKEDFINMLKSRFQCDVVILYGSHARGDATKESDLDFFLISSKQESSRFFESYKGILLDGFIYNEADVPPLEELRHLSGAKVLFDTELAAVKLLIAIERYKDNNPVVCKHTDKLFTKGWLAKTVKRIRKNDVEAHYRRHWMLFEILEIYCSFKGVEYKGSKMSLKEMQREDPSMFQLFSLALSPNARILDIENLVTAISNL